MKKPNENRKHDEMRPEYDFASMKGGVRAKYHEEYRKGTNVVLLEPDLAEASPTEQAMNEALRSILSKTRAVRRIGGRREIKSQNSRQRSRNCGGATS